MSPGDKKSVFRSGDSQPLTLGREAIPNKMLFTLPGPLLVEFCAIASGAGVLNNIYQYIMLGTLRIPGPVTLAYATPK